ncbi:MAG: phosphatase PAP2 family protein [Vicinamibacterales bacterium]
MRSSTAAASLLLTFVLIPAHVFAQDTSQQPPQKPQTPPAAVGEAGKKPVRSFPSALVHNLSDDLKHMPRRNSLYWLAGGTAVALAVHPEDKSINAHLATSKGANVLFKPGSIIGEGYVVLPAAAAVYAFGRWDGDPRVEHLGMDEIEGGLLGEGFVEGLKYIVRRPRPAPNKGQLTLASGYSFPSGHATLTFEAATILQQHLGYRAGIPTYIVATYVAISRLHDNVHYASDVAFGSALGILIGRAVTWHGRNFWGENISAPMPMMVRGGGGIMITVRPAADAALSHR